MSYVKSSIEAEARGMPFAHGYQSEELKASTNATKQLTTRNGKAALS